MVIHGDCLEEMDKLIDQGVKIDLTITSPPYDNLRTYNNSLEWDENIWKSVINKLYKITKNGGVVVWVVGDATINGSETGTSFKQALWAKKCGFNLHDTMIYIKEQMAFPSKDRYHQGFEYMFILSKGKPKTFNPIKDRKNKSFNRKPSKRTERNAAGKLIRKKPVKVREYSERFNHWLIYNLKRGFENNHPAIFPEKLASDHIISWSNEYDTVLEPFAGSGTTGIACQNLNRKYILIEKEQKYIDIINKRLEENNDHLFKGVS